MTQQTAGDDMISAAEHHLAAVKAARAARWLDSDQVLTHVTRWRGHGYDYRQRLHVLVGTLETVVEQIADAHEIVNCHAPACDCLGICRQIRMALAALAAFDEMASEA